MSAHIDWNGLLEHAVEARERAYAPYSRFTVGAALLSADGHVYVGCNVENVSFGATCCAERTALFKAISTGEKVGSFVALVVVADTQEPVTPCGMCRQVMVELCSPEMPLMLANMRGELSWTSNRELMPLAFARTNNERGSQSK